MDEREERQPDGDDLLRNPTAEELARMTPEERHADFERRHEAWSAKVAASLEPLEALAAGEDPVLVTLRARAEKAESERDEYLADLQRLAADFDNYRKRAARDQENTVLRAGERIVRDLLPVVDDLTRALEAAQTGAADSQLVEGIEMTLRNLMTLLEKEGIKEIETTGRFDPHLHEAVAALPADVEEGTVLEVAQKGYAIAGRVLRPARVVIASAPEAEDGREAKEE